MITLVLGGAESGKSAFAEQLAAAAGSAGGAVTYLATGQPAGDDDFAARVRRHRDRRPAGWRTVECGADLIAAVSGAEGVLLIESVGTWVASHLDSDVDVAGLCRALAAHDGPVVVVSEEVGLGVHPSTDLGGRFRVSLGRVNQALSQEADDAWLVVAGRPLRLGPPLPGPGPEAG